MNVLPPQEENTILPEIKNWTTNKKMWKGDKIKN